jgi:hypothetical protein
MFLQNVGVCPEIHTSFLRGRQTSIGAVYFFHIFQYVYMFKLYINNQVIQNLASPTRLNEFFIHMTTIVISFT